MFSARTPKRESRAWSLGGTIAAMIVVSGTKRSGTSMWMQLLHRAGLPVIGDAFPRDWSEVLRDGNQEGYYESRLRRGIYWETNPDPISGVYIKPEEVRLHGVKVFITGLTRTDLAFIWRVIATIRPWREYVHSVRRLYAIEDAARAERVRRGQPGVSLVPPPRMAPAYEWWFENYLLFGDALLRQYPIRFVAYDAVLENPHAVLKTVFHWLGTGDAEAAANQVKPSLRTARQATLQPLEPDEELPAVAAEAADELYRTICEGRPFEAGLIQRMNDANDAIADRVEAALEAFKG